MRGFGVFALLCATAWADPGALLATIKAARGPAALPSLNAAFQELIAKHPEAPELADACVRLIFVPPHIASPLLRSVLSSKVSPRAAGTARFVLARQLLDGLSNVAPASREATVQEARRLLDEVVATYADVPIGPKPAKFHAERALYEIEHLMPGKAAPEIEGEDLEGKPLKLSQFKGRVVLLSFWGAWCPPCVAALPEERKLADRFAGKEFVILGVNTDHDLKVARAIASSKGVTWRSFWDKSQTGPICTTYNVQGFPMLYLLDRQGVIRHRDLPPDEGLLASHIEALLAGK